MSKAIQNRLTKELKNLINNPISGSEVILEKEDDIRNWIVILKGPVGTPYENGSFKLKFTFPDNYPFKPPEVKFITSIYHPNVKLDTGEICLDVFVSTWVPTQNINEIIEKIVSILEAPSTSSPLEPAIADEYTNKYDDFVSKAKDYTKKYAVL